MLLNLYAFATKVIFLFESKIAYDIDLHIILSGSNQLLNYFSPV